MNWRCRSYVDTGFSYRILWSISGNHKSKACRLLRKTKVFLWFLKLHLNDCYLIHFRRSISKFYIGKSKSFTSLADAKSTSSVKDIAKPENPYNKKRKNLLTRTNLLDKNRICPLKSIGGGTSKRQANFNRSAYLLSETTNSSHDESSSVSTSPPYSSLPPLHPHGKRLPLVGSSSPPQRQSPWRSFSLSDLQSVCEPTPNITGLAISGEDKKTEIHWFYFSPSFCFLTHMALVWESVSVVGDLLNYFLVYSRGFLCSLTKL